LNEGVAPGQVIIKALPLLVPESIVQQDAEKRRVKRGILGGSEEQFVFGKPSIYPIWSSVTSIQLRNASYQSRAFSPKEGQWSWHFER